jgi:tetratricopeptide (TPR) repeat protein
MSCTRCIALLVFAVALALQGQQSNPSIASIESLIRSKDYDQALQQTKAALQKSPGNFQLWTLEGIVLSIKDSNEDALAAFQKALSISPSYPAALKGAVQLLYQAQDKRAIPLLEKMLKADPKDQTAQEMLADFQAVEGDCQAAIGHFALSAGVIATHPHSLEAYGYCLVQTQQREKAISVFEQLASLVPQRTYMQYDLAVLLMEDKQTDAALKVLEPLLATEQQDPDLLSLASEAYESAGDTPKAVALLRQAIVLRPAEAGYYIAFASICLDHESYQVGIDMIDAGLHHVSNDAGLYISRGLLYAQLANYDHAEADFKTAEDLDSSQSLSIYASDLATLQRDLADKGSSDQALQEVRAQLKLHPENPLLHCLLAKLLTSGGGDDTDATASQEAIGSALQAVKLKPDFVDARDILAGLYTRSGQYQQAIEQCRLALQYSPSDKIAIYHLIVALRHISNGGQRVEIEMLVKRLSDLQQASRQQDLNRKRFKLEVQRSAP